MGNNENKPGRYARILQDYWFKRSFGSERWKRLIVLFLQEVIPERKIEELTFVSQEHLNPSKDKKGIRIDVECVDKDRTRFVVEMQLAEQHYFYQRAVFNSTFAIQKQLDRGSRKYHFNPVYFIGVLNFSLHQGTDRVLFRYDLRERETHELMTDRVQYIFLELPNCSRALTPNATILDNFCYALYNMERLPDKPQGMDSELFQLLFDSAEIANFTPEEKFKYDLDMRTERDFLNQLDFARDKGKEEGREEGKELAKKAIAERLLAMGMSQEKVDVILAD